MPSINCNQCGKHHSGACFSCPACHRHHNPRFCPGPRPDDGLNLSAFDNIVGTMNTANGPVQMSGAPSALAAALAQLGPTTTAPAVKPEEHKEEEKEKKEERKELVGEELRALIEKKRKKNHRRHQQKKRAVARKRAEREEIGVEMEEVEGGEVEGATSVVIAERSKAINENEMEG